MIRKMMDTGQMVMLQLSETQIAEIYQQMDQSFVHGAPWTWEQFIVDLTNETTNYLFIEVHGQIVGFVSYRQIIDEMEIDEVLIFKEFQHQGYGTKLMQMLFHEARKNQVQSIFLEVRQSNSPAIALYEKCGFKQIAKRKNYYQHPVEDAWIYQYQRED